MNHKKQLDIKVSSFDVARLDDTCKKIASVMQGAFGNQNVSVFATPCRKPLINIKRSPFAYSNSVWQGGVNLYRRCIRVYFNDMLVLQKKLGSIELPEGVHLKSILSDVK